MVRNQRHECVEYLFDHCDEPPEIDIELEIKTQKMNPTKTKEWNGDLYFFHIAALLGDYQMIEILCSRLNNKGYCKKLIGLTPVTRRGSSAIQLCIVGLEYCHRWKYNISPGHENKSTLLLCHRLKYEESCLSALKTSLTTLESQKKDKEEEIQATKVKMEISEKKIVHWKQIMFSPESDRIKCLRSLFSMVQSPLSVKKDKDWPLMHCTFLDISKPETCHFEIAKYLIEENKIDNVTDCVRLIAAASTQLLKLLIDLHGKKYNIKDMDCCSHRGWNKSSVISSCCDFQGFVSLFENTKIDKDSANKIIISMTKIDHKCDWIDECMEYIVKNGCGKRGGGCVLKIVYWVVSYYI